MIKFCNVNTGVQSLSARRAWIEMILNHLLPVTVKVALRKESVDRNHGIGNIPLHIVVALRKESVDRNAERMKVGGIDVCRSPQGERG